MFRSRIDIELIIYYTLLDSRQYQVEWTLLSSYNIVQLLRIKFVICCIKIQLEWNFYSRFSSSSNCRTKIIELWKREKTRERKRAKYSFNSFMAVRVIPFSLRLILLLTKRVISCPFLLSSWESLVRVCSFIIITMGWFWLTQSKSSQLCVQDKRVFAYFIRIDFFPSCLFLLWGPFNMRFFYLN
jgi:hypothetical protein